MEQLQHVQCAASPQKSSFLLNSIGSFEWNHFVLKKKQTNLEKLKDQRMKSEEHGVWQCHIYANQLRGSASDYIIIVLYIWVIDSNPFKCKYHRKLFDWINLNWNIANIRSTNGEQWRTAMCLPKNKNQQIISIQQMAVCYIYILYRISMHMKLYFPQNSDAMRCEMLILNLNSFVKWYII